MQYDTERLVTCIKYLMISASLIIDDFNINVYGVYRAYFAICNCPGHFSDNGLYSDIAMV